MTELAELGLSSYEEKVYRTLLVTGAVGATTLSDASGVPRGRIYDVLNGLKARKLIRTRDEDPRQYTAVEPDTAVDRLLAEREHELTKEWARYQDRAKAVRSNLMPTPPIGSSFWLGSLGSEEMSTALQQHMRTAEDSVHAVVGIPYENAAWETVKTEVDAFFAGANEGLSVDLILSEKVAAILPDTFPQTIEEKSADVAIRTLPDVILSYDVVDKVETTVDIPHPVNSDDRLGMFGIKESRVVDEFERHFQQLWTQAAPLIE